MEIVAKIISINKSTEHPLEGSHFLCIPRWGYEGLEYHILRGIDKASWALFCSDVVE